MKMPGFTASAAIAREMEVFRSQAPYTHGSFGNTVQPALEWYCGRAVCCFWRSGDGGFIGCSNIV
jgi:hypothetical protein